MKIEDSKVPCYHCDVRTETCHISCPAYQHYAEICRERRRIAFEEAEKTSFVVERIIRAKSCKRKQR